MNLSMSRIVKGRSAPFLGAEGATLAALGHFGSEKKAFDPGEIVAQGHAGESEVFGETGELRPLVDPEFHRNLSAGMEVVRRGGEETFHHLQTRFASVEGERWIAEDFVPEAATLRRRLQMMIAAQQ